MSITMHCSKSTYVPEVQCKIDSGIASLIGRLNRADYPTAYSCSGLWEDHMNITRHDNGNPDWEENVLRSIDPQPYLAFHFDKLTLRQIKDIAEATQASGSMSACHITGSPLRLDVVFAFAQNHYILLKQIVKKAQKRARRHRKNRDEILIQLIKQQGNPRREFEIRRFWSRFEETLLHTNGSTVLLA